MSSPLLKYRADIDGLRAVAVLAVLFFHTDLGFPGGYVGVDVFFVISGYLITGLILKDLGGGRFNLVAFWERRIRRILPALTLVIVSCLTVGWFLFLPVDYRELGQSVVAQVFLASNIHFWMKSEYFAQAAEVKPLLHTWSLAVEEQFYLMFPLVIIAVTRFSRTALVPVILLLCSASFTLSVYCGYRHNSLNFYLLPTRAWELLLGALISGISAPTILPRWLKECLTTAGFIAILYAVFFYDRNTRFPGAAALMPCGGAALVIYANDQSATIVGRLLAARPMVFIGLISYSLYLWHWPVLVFSKYWALYPYTASQRILLLIVIFTISTLSWKFIEKPFRKHVIITSRTGIFTFAFGIVSALLIVGFIADKMLGMPWRLPEQAQKYARGLDDRWIMPEIGLKEALNGDFFELGSVGKQSPVNLLIWGDSHAMALLPVLDVLCREHHVRGVAAVHSSTAPLVGYESLGEYSLGKSSLAFNDAVVDFILKNHVPNVLLAARWRGYDPPGLRRGFASTFSALKRSGTRIWIMKPVPEYEWLLPKALASAVLFNRDSKQLGMRLNRHKEASQPLAPLFAECAQIGFEVLDSTDMFVGTDGRCRVEAGGFSLYTDTHHLSTHGALLLRPLFEPIFGSETSSHFPRKGD